MVYVSSQGYGRGGPLGEMPSYGPLNNGFAGLHHLWNHPDVPYPCGTALNHPDHIAGKLLAVGVLAALDHRRRTGEGQRVEMAQTEVAAYLLGEVYLDAALRGADPQAQGNARDDAVPHGVYPAAGDDRWLAVSVLDDEAWRRMCEATGWPLEASTATLRRPPGQPRSHRQAGRRVDVGPDAPRTRPPRLQAHGVSAMPVMGPQDHLSDPHLLERGFIVTLQHPEVGSERHCGNPIHLSRLAQRTARSAPCLGVDTEEVLGDRGSGWPPGTWRTCGPAASAANRSVEPDRRGPVTGSDANRSPNPDRRQASSEVAQARSKRSRFMTLSQAATKSWTNFSLASSQA